ncbi:MAG TPA: hypothetical protein VNC18_17605 [Gemmatimonadaceae bacterium]|jgi:hypothetical protein|nr:hypothetical protein [Gemmatimonadaceae bacterium]
MTKVVKDETKAEGAPGSLTLATTERPKRVTQTEMLRSLLNRGASPTGERGSVELSRNAKHEVQYKVTVYHDDPDEALAQAVKLENALALLYPQPPPSA